MTDLLPRTHRRNPALPRRLHPCPDSMRRPLAYLPAPRAALSAAVRPRTAAPRCGAISGRAYHDVCGAALRPVPPSRPMNPTLLILVVGVVWALTDLVLPGLVVATSE